jgi:hypothetical protein
MVWKHDISRRKQILAMKMDFWRHSETTSRKDKIPKHTLREKKLHMNLYFGLYKIINIA